jgi:hypothetical protein
LRNENWENVFGETDANGVNTLFNNFLNTYLRNFESCFLKKKVLSNQISNPWITIGIRISCARKKELYLITRRNKDIILKQYYKIYCKILSNTIKAVKKLYCDKMIIKSDNKMKTTWRIILTETNKTS